MARIWTDGAETGDLLFWSATTTITASTEQARTGTYSYRIGNNGTATRNISAANEVFIRFGMNETAPMQTIAFFTVRSGSTTVGTLRIDTTTRRLLLYNGTTLVATSDTPLPAATWARLELRWRTNATNGAIELRLDGTTIASFSGNTGSAAIDSMSWSKPATGLYYIDDLALNDTTGAIDNTWCGEGRVQLQIVDGPGDSASWTPSAGANWQCVDEIPPDGDTTYVESATAGAQDLYTIADFDATNKTILRAQIIATARGTVGGEQVKLQVKSGSTVADVGTVALTTAYAQYRSNDMPTNPVTSAPWDDLAIDGLQIGQEVV